MRRFVPVFVALAVAAAACGDSDQSVPDYIEQVEAITQSVGNAFDELDAEREAQGSPTVADTQAYLDSRVELRAQLLTDFEALSPPDQLANLQAEAVASMERVLASEEALADLAADAETSADIDAVWSSPEAVAWRAADLEIMAVCQSAEAEFDTPEELEDLGDLPWLPSEMGEVLSVALGCTPEQRAAD